MKRFRARARGRASRIMKPFSNLTIVVREVEEPVMGQKVNPIGLLASASTGPGIALVCATRIWPTACTRT